jgi:uncharacterized protein (DUF4415 family)
MPERSRKLWEQARSRALRAACDLSDAEDAEIKNGIARDPTASEMTEEMWSRARPAIGARPKIVTAYRRRSRGAQKRPTKQLVSIRLDPDVVKHFRKSGRRWQRRINDALRKTARLAPKDRTRSITERSPRVRRPPPRGR